MWRVVLGAVRARPVQALTVLLLSALVSAAAVAGPWWLTAASQRVAASDVAAAPPAQRMLSVRRLIDTSGDPAAALAAFRTSVERQLPIRAPGPVLGLTQSLRVSVGDTTRDIPVVYRDGVCAHLRISGRCPTAPGEALLSQYAADLLGLGVGDPLPLIYQVGDAPLRLRVVGRYEVSDPGSGYWADPLFTPGGGAGGLDAVFVPLPTFGATGLTTPSAAYSTQVPAALLRPDRVDDLARRLRQVDYVLHNEQFFLVAPTEQLLAAVDADRTVIRRGILLGIAQVVVLCWLALALAGRYTATYRRADVALLKLHGAGARRVLRLTVGQHLVPMAAGLPPGVLLGYLGARALAGPVTGAGAVPRCALWCAGAVLVALGGGLVALPLSEAAAIRAPVAALLRQVAPGRRGRLADLLDLAVVALAVAALVQARTGGATGFGLGAAPLLALALAVLLARLLGWLVNRLGAGGLRSGRLRAGLTAVLISRRPGADRVFALIAVAVAILGTAVGGFAAGSAGRAARADLELGAARVLTVQAANRTALLSAVRQADPGGRAAMAVVADPTAQPPVLAVDAGRLAAVVHWRADYGPVPTLTGDALPAGVPVTGRGLTVRARNGSAAAVSLLVELRDESIGLDESVLVGPIPPGEHAVTAPVRGCAGPAGCRLLGLDLDQPSTVDGVRSPARPGARLTVEEVRQHSPETTILDGTVLGDPRRWRPGIVAPALSVAARQQALTLAIPLPPAPAGDAAPFDGAPVPAPPTPDNRAFVVDTPLPVPVVLAGPLPAAWQLSDPVLNLFGGGPVPVRVAATTGVLPVLGRAGVLVDLDAASRVAGTGSAGTFQVWLAGGAPAGLPDRLRAAGLTILDTDSLAARQRVLATHGPATVARFQLLAAIVGLLLAGAALTVAAAVERDFRRAELRALRAQGLPARTAGAVGYLGWAGLIGLGVLAGLLATGTGYALVGRPTAVFIDGWSVLPAPGGLPPLALLAVAVGAPAVIGLMWWLSALPTGRGAAT